MYCIQKPGYKTTANVFPFFKKGYPEKEEQQKLFFASGFLEIFFSVIDSKRILSDNQIKRAEGNDIKCVYLSHNCDAGFAPRKSSSKRNISSGYIQSFASFHSLLAIPMPVLSYSTQSNYSSTKKQQCVFTVDKQRCFYEFSTYLSTDIRPQLDPEP